ncbi:MAG: hypothetical protein EPN17_00960 [Methylobacter sp.]|nr:MAG: hypothetical protein EPN17_00960 [Methylobacter sp.]
MSDPLAPPPAPAPGASPETPSTQQTATPPAIDVQAQVNQARAELQADFAKQLQEITGHSDLKSLSEANLKAQGKLQELADSKTAEALSFKAKFEQAAISNALLQSASDAIDPAVVSALLSGQCVCDANGAVTIDGKPVSDAVKSLLAAKPFLAKVQGSPGSGTPPATEVTDAAKTQQDYQSAAKAKDVLGMLKLNTGAAR